MKKSTFLPVKKMAIVLTVILAGLVSFGSLKAQTVITSVTIGAQSGSVTYGTASSVTFPISFTTSGTGVGSSTLSINWTGAAPAGVTITFPVTIDPSAVPSPVTLTITTTSATPAGTISFTISSLGEAHISAPANFVVGGKPITVINITGHNKIYDATPVATVDGTPDLSGVVSGDVPNVILGGSPVFAFADALVGTAKQITLTTGYTITGTAAGNYLLIQPTYLTANITTKALTITGLTGANKNYDGGTVATTTGTAALSGVFSGDTGNVTIGGTAVLNFSDALVGNGKAITVTGYTITGSASANYTLTQPAGLTANIIAKALTITGLTGVNRVYNGGTTATTTGTALPAGVVSGDTGNVTLGGTPVLNFADALVGDTKPITVTGYTISGTASANYSLTQPAGLTANITPLALTINGLTGVDKVYNGTTDASTSGTATLSGIISPDDVTLDGTGAYSFATATVGTTKPITVTGFTLGGAAAANYSIGPLIGVTANITAKPLTIPDAAASNKPYDATLAATITGTLTGIINPDVVTLTGTGTFASASVGTGIAVTSTSALAGAAAGNYSLTQPGGLTANITPKPLSIAAIGPAKFYGIALTAGSSTTNFTTSALVGTEAITSVTLRPNAAGLLASTAAGAAYIITPELPITGSGGFLLSNYTITYVPYAGTVSPKPITVTPNAGQQKLIGAADPVLTYTYAPALIGTDAFTGALSRTAGETVAGNPYVITIGTLTAGPNYILTLAPATFAITAISDDFITAFNFTFLPNYAEVINQGNGTIAVPVANSANITTLVARFTASPGAIVRVGSVVQTSGITVNNFTSVVTYVATSADGLSTKSYNITVTKNPVVIDKQLLSFSFAAIPGATGVIDQTAFTVSVPVPLTYNVTNLVATFTLSPMAKAFVGGVLQTSGVTANNFTAGLTAPGFTYTIQAENGGTLVYDVTLTRAAPSTEKQLLTFALPGIEGAVDEVAHTVELTVPYAYVLAGRAATFTSSLVSTVWIGTTQQVSGVTTNDFTLALTSLVYTVKAENLDPQNYTVHITRIAASTARQMITFQFNGLAAAANGVIDEATGTIAVIIPFSANKASLVATFTHSALSTVTINGTTQVSGTTPNNFTADVTYRVTAENGTDFKDYLVHVSQTPASTARQLLTFNVAVIGGTAIGTVDQVTKSVLVEVPYGTNIADLVATFTVSSFATVRIGPAVGGAVQISGITHNNFSGPQAYTVVAENTGYTEVYLVVVRVFPAFVNFSFNDALALPVGIINHTAHTVTVHVPFSVDKTTLKAFFTVSGGAIVSIGSIAQTSGVTVNNFTNPQTYTLQVPGGSTSYYVVSLVSDPVKTGKQLLTFAFNGLTPVCTGVISETLKTVTATVPYGTDVTTLVATFTLSDLASAKVGTTVQASGTTPNNFTSAVVYTITAENADTQTYTITVIVTPGSTAKDITYFAFEDLNPDVVGVISETYRTITATVPNGTDRSILRAFYTASPLSTVRVLGAGGGLQQSGLTVNDFRFQLQYEVTAQDGSFKVYTVSVGESADITPPIVSNAIQTASNLPGQFVLVRTNEATGKVYIIINTVLQSTIAELEAAVTAGYGRAVYVSAANTDIPISTANLPAGSYYAYAIDAAGNKSLRGGNAITVLDRIAPTVSVATQTKSNSVTNVVNVTSSDASSLVYLILEGVLQTSKIQLDAAVSAHQGVRGLVISANVDVPLSVYGLFPGNYHAYAVDMAGNLSAPSTNVVIITEASRSKSILAYSFNGMTPPAIGQIVGTDISVMVRVGIPVTAIRATFTLSELSNAYVGSTLQVSNVTENDFTNPVVYRVIAENGTYFDYTVTVSFNTGVDVSEWFSSIKSYPNPVSDRLTIEMTRPADRIQIINGLGQTMEDIRNPGQTTVEIQTSTWMKGIYFIRYFREEKFIGVQKIIKE